MAICEVVTWDFAALKKEVLAIMENELVPSETERYDLAHWKVESQESAQGAFVGWESPMVYHHGSRPG